MKEHRTGHSSTRSGSGDDGVPIRSAEATRYARLSLDGFRYLERLKLDPALGLLSIEEERARMRCGQSASLHDFPVLVETIETSACPVYLVRPLDATSVLPVTFYLHGGGWVLGDLKTHTRLVCELALRSQAAIAFIDYPRAPEHPFPGALEACLTAVTDLLEKAPSLDLDASRFGIAGDSSGGNLAAALILSARERKLRMPVCQILLYPAIDPSCATESYREYEHNPNLGLETMKWFWANYLPDASTGANPLASPLRASQAALADFPATLLITCEYDVLRDEGEQLAARLTEAGVEVTAVRWLGSLHGFLVTEPLMESASSESCIAMIAHYLRDAYRLSRK